MITRKNFIQSTGMLAAGALLSGNKLFAQKFTEFESKRPPLADRKFTSDAVEAMIKKIKAGLPNKELGWLFENCFPNTLDTTVDFSMVNDKRDTYVITGDIDAMWLRDSSAQVWPYMALLKEDKNYSSLSRELLTVKPKTFISIPMRMHFTKMIQK